MASSRPRGILKADGQSGNLRNCSVRDLTCVASVRRFNGAKEWPGQPGHCTVTVASFLSGSNSSHVVPRCCWDPGYSYSTWAGPARPGDMGWPCRRQGSQRKDRGTFNISWIERWNLWWTGWWHGPWAMGQDFRLQNQEILVIPNHVDAKEFRDELNTGALLRLCQHETSIITQGETGSQASWQLVPFRSTDPLIPNTAGCIVLFFRLKRLVKPKDRRTEVFTKPAQACTVHLAQAARDCHVPGSFGATHSTVPWTSLAFVVTCGDLWWLWCWC